MKLGRSERNSASAGAPCYADHPMAFAQAQMALWRTRRPAADLEPLIRAEMQRHPNVFLLEIFGRDVVVRQNGAIDELLGQGHELEVVRRIGIFRRLVSDAIRDAPVPRRLVIAIDTGDLAEDRGEVPVFSFQRRKGDRTLLLPDFELIGLNYLDVDVDRLPFREKANQAFFSGSTTGKSNFTLEDVARGEVPRVRAARFFRDSPLVRFLLPSIVQHASDEVAATLRAEGFGRDRTSLLDTYAFKFGISMDGNGAPCSRPAIVLRSNSVLLKYGSPFELYYDMGLVPWLHFIPVGADADVIEIVETETGDPGRFEYIADEGRAFANAILGKASILAYTRHLLDLYEEVWS